MTDFWTYGQGSNLLILLIRWGNGILLLFHYQNFAVLKNVSIP